MNKNIALLVYGSLINKNELLNEGINISKCLPVRVNGFKREFAQEPSWRKSTSINRSVLNVSINKDFKTNVLLLPILNKNEFITLDEREKGYIRTEVNIKDIDFIYEKKENINYDKIYIYVGKKEKYNNEILPNMNYLNICLEGAKTWGEDFYKDFLSSTFVKNEALKSFIYK